VGRLKGGCTREKGEAKSDGEVKSTLMSSELLTGLDRGMDGYGDIL